MMKAADNLKTQQKQLESERNNVLSKRLPQCPNIDGIEDKGLLPFSCCKKVYIVYNCNIYYRAIGKNIPRFICKNGSTRGRKI